MSGHDARAVRGRDGHVRWSAVCVCGWREQAFGGAETARLAAARHLAEQVKCDCYYPDEMEYEPHPCPRCALLELLGGVA